MTTDYRPGRGNKGPSPEWAERAAHLRDLHDAGLSWADIGVMLGVSRQRAHQLANRDPDGSAYRRSHVSEMDYRRERYHRLHPDARYNRVNR